VANTEADWQTAPTYSFTETDVVDGKPESTKTYKVMMIDGSPYNEVVVANGRPLTSAESAHEAHKLRAEIARRQHETPDERQTRIAQYDRERRQDRELLQQMVKAMDFRVMGEETVNGRRCFVLEGLPKPGYRPINRDAKVLTGMRGKMWIDEQEYQWVKVEAEVFRPVAFGMFIAHVEPGTKFTLEQQPVEGKLWLPSHFEMRVRAKVLGFWSHNSNDEETYSDYRRGSQNGGASAATRADPGKPGG